VRYRVAPPKLRPLVGGPTRSGVAFAAPLRFIAQRLARALHSSVRVSRRAAPEPDSRALPERRRRSPGPGTTRPAGFTIMPRPRGHAFRSRYFFSIGLGDIRFLGWKAPPLRSELPTTATLLPRSRGALRLRATTGSASSRKDSRSQRPPGPHSSSPHAQGAGFGAGPGRFARRYSGRRVCFRFLPLLICLSSGSLPPARPS